MKKRNEIAIWSAMPPPYGGISVHIMRLVHRLMDTGIPYRMIDQNGKFDPETNVVPGRRSIFGFLHFALTNRSVCVHLHTNNLLAVAVGTLIFKARRVKVIYTLHTSFAVDRYISANPFAKKLIRTGLRRAWHFVPVNNHVAEWLKRDLAIPAERITVSPAYIPPSELEVKAPLPDGIVNSIKNASCVIGSQGWFGPLQQGVHIYSFDLLHMLALHLKSNWPGTWLYTMVSGDVDSAFRDECKARVEADQLESVWHFIEEPISGAAIIAKSQLFLRPTTTDGDSVCVRESLGLNVPVVASDAVVRPDSCHLFCNRDIDDLIRVVEAFLHGELRDVRDDSSDSFLALQGIYRRALGS